MSKVQTFYLKASKLSLKQMETRINNDEGMFLRLEMIGHTDTETLCTYSRATSAPTKKIALREAPSAEGKIVCTGKIWVGGALKEVVAYRLP